MELFINDKKTNINTIKKNKGKNTLMSNYNKEKD